MHVPVTTGETWDIWLKHPELVREVDYIAAHILPYWEGIPAEEVVDCLLDLRIPLTEKYLPLDINDDDILDFARREFHGLLRLTQNQNLAHPSDRVNLAHVSQ